MIEVGEYVRVKNGGIGKVIELFGETGIETDNENIDIGWDGEGISDTYVQHIVKHSKNIIDLIEVGDYINGERVIEIDDDIKSYGEKTYIAHSGRYFGSQIFRIVTKEQFANMEYRLEENK